MSGGGSLQDSQMISASLEKSLSQQRMEMLPDINNKRGGEDNNTVARFGRVSGQYAKGGSVLENQRFNENEVNAIVS